MSAAVNMNMALMKLNEIDIYPLSFHSYDKRVTYLAVSRNYKSRLGFNIFTLHSMCVVITTNKSAREKLNCGFL